MYSLCTPPPNPNPSPPILRKITCGRLPIKLTIDTSIVKFWIHLQNLPENNIAKQCLQISKEMADKNQLGLVQKINYLCSKYNSNSITLNENNGKIFTSHIKRSISKALTEHQLNLINTNRKLNFYATFKQDTKKSDFLDLINNPHHRIAINKFRLGNHKLHIETGRYTIPKTPVDSRICSFCHSNEIENETHFIFSCKLYDSIRLKFFNAITIKYSNFQNLDINSKTLFLCNNVDPDVCRSTAAFVFQATSLRHKVLFEK